MERLNWHCGDCLSFCRYHVTSMGLALTSALVQNPSAGESLCVLVSTFLLQRPEAMSIVCWRSLLAQ